MKNSNDIIRNRTRDLPTCSAVPQPTALGFVFNCDICSPCSIYNWNFFVAFRINQSAEYYEYIINSVNGYVSRVIPFILYSVFLFSARADMAVR